MRRTVTAPLAGGVMKARPELFNAPTTDTAGPSAMGKIMSKTVIQHVLSRLHDIGVKCIFGVAGDFAFPVDDAICADHNLRWIGACNELNAAYAAAATP